MKILQDKNFCIFAMFYILLFGCINIEYFHFNEAYFTSSKLTDKVKFFRSLIPFFIIFQFIIFLLVTIYKRKKLKINIYISLLILYVILQTVGIFLTDINPLHNIFYAFLFLGVLLVFFQINQLEDEMLNKIFNLSFIVLFTLFFIFFNQNIYLYFNSDFSFYSEFPAEFRSDRNPQLLNPNISLDNNLKIELINDTIYRSILGENPPRSSGISRIALILSLILLVFLIIKNQYKNLITFLLFYLNFAIFISLSRINILCVLIFSLFVIYFSSFTFREKLKKIMLILLLPFLIANYLNFAKDKSIFPFQNNLLKSDNSQTTIEIKRNVKKRNFHLFTLTGRNKIWNDIYYANKDKWYIGNGPQADRYMVNQSASNLISYSYITGGIISSFIFVVIYLKIIFNITKIVVNNGIEFIFKDYYLYSSILVILFLFLRSVVETSFGVFGIDLIIFLTSLVIFDRKLKTL